MSEREAWLWMLSQAAYEETTQNVAGMAVTVPRGAFLTTLRQLQSRFMWASEKRVRTFLLRLENGRMIGRSLDGPRGAKRTQISICNYEQFQETGRRSVGGVGRSLDAARGEQNNKGITNNNTLAKASDSGAVDFTKEVFDRGVAFLSKYGTPDRQARALIGKWRKDSGDGEVFNALRDANRNGVTDPVPWIMARLKPREEINFVPDFDLSDFEGDAQ